MQCPDENTLLELARGNLAARPQSSEIEDHIDSCRTCSRILAQLLRSGGEEEIAPLESLESLARGAEVDRYVVLDRVGEGASGVVFSAYDPELDRKIALKLLRSGAWNPARAANARARMLREAKALAKVSHPNIVTVFHAGVIAGQVFIAMELVEGGSLRRWLAQEPRSTKAILRVFLQAGRGLGAAHERGLVHRDFKPDNVLVGQDGRVRVTDFGLARSVGPEAALDPAAALAPSEIDQTREGALLGTPAYMAPEQLQGLAADARSDQFSFCAALHEALYGERPFAGASLKELAAEVLAGRIRPAARRSSQVPTKVRRALLRGLSVGPELRFPSMEALLQVLERPSASRRLGTAAASLALVGLAVVGLGWLAHGKLAQCRGQEEKVAGAWGLARKDAARAAFAASGVPGAAETWQTVERSLDAYAERWSAQHREACAATRLRGEQSESVLDLRMQCLERRLRELDALARLLSSADATVVNAASRSGESLSRVEDCADIAGLTSPLKASADPKTRSEVARLQAEIAQAAALRSVGKYREAVQLAEGTAASASALGWRPLVAEAQESLGLALRRAGSEPRAASALFEAAWAAEASRHDVVAARAYSELVYVQGYRLGQRSEAHHLERQAAAALERLGPGHEDIEALLLRYSGSLLFSESRFAEAVEMDRRATALAEKVYGAQSLVVADSYSALGVSLNDSGQYEEAVIFHRKALALREKIAGPNHLETASTLGSLSLALGALGDSAAADELSRRALAIAQASLPKDHPDLAFMFHWTGRVQLDLGHTREALELLDRAEKMRERQLGSDHPLLGETLVQRARALLELGRTEESLAVAQRAVAIAKPRAEEDRLLFAAALVGLGQALLAQKQPAAATAPLDQAVAIYDAGGALPEAGAEASFALAQALRSNHQDPSRALRLGQRAQEGFLKAGKRSAARARAVDAWLGP